MYTDLIQRKDAKRERRKTLNRRSTLMNADTKGLQARQMIARGEAPGPRSKTISSPERARQAWLRESPEPLREAFQAANQSAQAAGYSDWLAADEAALANIANIANIATRRKLLTGLCNETAPILVSTVRTREPGHV
jgi:hypothetical protein